MSKRSTNCSRPRRSTAAAGLTLIEVVAGLALMASILTSLLYARTRYARALHDAEQRTRACAAADRLLTDWRMENHGPPSAAHGDVAGNSQLQWQTSVVKSDEAARVAANIVRLSILATDRPAVTLAAVDVLVATKARER